MADRRSCLRATFPRILRRNAGISQTIESFGLPATETRKPAPFFWLGEAVSIKPPTRIEVDRRPGDNLLIVGQDAAFRPGNARRRFLTLAAQQPVGRRRPRARNSLSSTATPWKPATKRNGSACSRWFRTARSAVASDDAEPGGTARGRSDPPCRRDPRATLRPSFSSFPT